MDCNTGKDSSGNRNDVGKGDIWASNSEVTSGITEGSNKNCDRPCKMLISFDNVALNVMLREEVGNNSSIDVSSKPLSSGVIVSCRSINSSEFITTSSADAEMLTKDVEALVGDGEGRETVVTGIITCLDLVTSSIVKSGKPVTCAVKFSTGSGSVEYGRSASVSFTITNV